MAVLLPVAADALWQELVYREPPRGLPSDLHRPPFNIPEGWELDEGPAHVPVPQRTGIIGVYRPNAEFPLTIHLPADQQSYYFKLQDAKGTAADFFIQSGGSIALQVPAGSFVLKFAKGVSWFGTQALFGKETKTRRLVPVLDFSVQSAPDGKSYVGHEITLQKTPAGNIANEELPANEF